MEHHRWGQKGSKACPGIKLDCAGVSFLVVEVRADLFAPARPNALGGFFVVSFPVS